MTLRYSLSAYCALLAMTHEKHILVEGKDDKCVVLELIMRCKEMPHDQTLWGLSIESADEIENDTGLKFAGNREYVERIHSKVKSTPYGAKLVSIVDREYREFSFSPEVTDNLGSHFHSDGLTWTIGHSIENYMFAIDVLCDGFNSLCGCQSKHTAQMLLRNIYVDAVRKVAAASLAAHSHGLSDIPKGTLRWEHMRPSETVLQIAVDDWREAMGCHGDAIVNEFQAWLPRLALVDVAVCQRLCRGHTGIVLFQKVFAACVFTAHYSLSEDEARSHAMQIATLPESLIRNILAAQWAKDASTGLTDFPKVFLNSI